MYADLQQYNDIGINKGIHLWSIKVLLIKRSHCYLSIGITTEKNMNIINHKSTKKTWIKEGSNSHCDIPFAEPRIDAGDTVTMELNCNEWSVTYYRNKSVIKTDKIDANKCYYLAMLYCENSTYVLGF